MTLRACFVLSALFLAACGGGDGGGNTRPNAPPTFTSLQTASVVENSTAAYQATASDADGDALTFAIDGGPDASLFSITAAGALRFNTPPDFELPANGSRANIYSVRLRVTDGRDIATQEVRITVTNSREGIAVTRVATGFDRPQYVAAIPGDSRVYVGERSGKVYRLDPADGSRTLVLDIPDISSDFGERGLLGLAAYPNHATSRRLFVVATNLAGDIEVRSYTLGLPQSSTSYLTALSIPSGPAAKNNGGWIGFGPDGYVYVAVGDRSGAVLPANDAQNRNSRLGKILRFAINPDPFAGASPQYFIPAPGNPYISGGGDPYVYAMGLRNPRRASFSGATLLIGDAGGPGQEINMLTTTQPGLNFGWPFRTAGLGYLNDPPDGLIEEVLRYSDTNDLPNGRDVVGGYVYRGPIASLQGQYVFADTARARFWTVPFSGLVPGQIFPTSRFSSRVEDFTPDTGSIDQFISFGEDSAGNLFFVDLDGDIFMMREGT